VFFAICRKTIGWHKETDSISLSQLVELTGCNDATVKTCLRVLKQKDLITVELVNGHASRFSLNIQNDDPPQNLGGEGVQKLGGDPPQNLPPTKETIQKKLSKETLHSPKAHADNLTRSITDYYQSLFVEEYQCKPTWDGKIMKLVKADISRLGDVLLGELIQIFFEDPGAFVTRNGTGMGYNIFHSQIDALLEKKRRAG
jgi:Bacteriophage replication protein O